MSKRPDYKMVLQTDHIKRLEEEIKQLKKENEKLKDKIEFIVGDIKVVENIRDELEKKLRAIKKVCNKFIPDHYKILLIINDGVVEE